MIFGECDQCGAVISAEDEDGTTWGDRSKHEDWHRKTEEYINMLYRAPCNETQQRLEMILHA